MDALTEALVFYDAVMDDARHRLTVARTAAAHGAIIRTSSTLVDLVMDKGHVVGGRIHDVENGVRGPCGHGRSLAVSVPE